jgi:hypothetical protein
VLFVFGRGRLGWHGRTNQARGLLNCLPKIDEESETLPTLVRDPSWALNGGRTG